MLIIWDALRPCVSQSDTTSFAYPRHSFFSSPIQVVPTQSHPAAEEYLSAMLAICLRSRPGRRSLHWCIKSVGWFLIGFMVMRGSLMAGGWKTPWKNKKKCSKPPTRWSLSRDILLIPDLFCHSVHSEISQPNWGDESCEWHPLVPEFNRFDRYPLVN